MRDGRAKMRAEPFLRGEKLSLKVLGELRSLPCQTRCIVTPHDITRPKPSFGRRLCTRLTPRNTRSSLNSNHCFADGSDCGSTVCMRALMSTGGFPPSPYSVLRKPRVTYLLSITGNHNERPSLVWPVEGHGRVFSARRCRRWQTSPRNGNSSSPNNLMTNLAS